MMTPHKRWFPIVVLGLLSCTIVEDEDITSSEEAVSLLPQIFTISQKTAKGSGTLEIRLLYDSVQNFTDATTNTKITRKVGYSIPAIGNLKLKLRSGSTLATSIHITYTDFKKPYTAYIQEKDSVIEIYRFRYSPAKQVNRIITIINKVDNLPPTVRTNDTLIYKDNMGAIRISTLTRRVGGVGTSYNVEYRTNSDDSWVMSLKPSSGSGSVFDPPQTWSGCESVSCAVYQKSQSSDTPIIIISGFQVNTALINLNLKDFRQSCTGNCQPRETDTYYFHPLMLLRGQHTDGHHLLAIYLLDWWVPGPVAVPSTNGLSSEEDVTFSVKY